MVKNLSTWFLKIRIRSDTPLIRLDTKQYQLVISRFIDLINHNPICLNCWNAFKGGTVCYHQPWSAHCRTHSGVSTRHRICSPNNHTYPFLSRNAAPAWCSFSEITEKRGDPQRLSPFGAPLLMPFVLDGSVALAWVLPDEEPDTVDQ
jgi:hypothetical protein